MIIRLLFRGLQAPRGRTSWCVANQYRQSSRLRCGGVLLSRRGLASPRYHMIGLALYWMRVELGTILMKFAFEISVQLWSPL